MNGGRILILWDENVLDVQVLMKTNQLIHFEVRGKVMDWCCLVSIVYAANDQRVERAFGNLWHI